ncbi:hypothetical protein SRHO_G00019570 [Serrasalmus rhombeus]
MMFFMMFMLSVKGNRAADVITPYTAAVFTNEEPTLFHNGSTIHHTANAEILNHLSHCNIRCIWRYNWAKGGKCQPCGKRNRCCYSEMLI